MSKTKHLVLIFVFVPTLFAGNPSIKSNWQFSKEYSRNGNVFFNDYYYYDSDNKPSKFGTYAKEFGYSFGASAVCLVAVAGISVATLSNVTSFNLKDEDIDKLTFIISIPIILIPAASAWGTYEAAKDIDPGGSYWISCLGAFSGLIVGSGLGLGSGYVIDKTFNQDQDSGFQHWWLAIPMAILGTSFGAVIGYNLSVPKESESSEYGFFYQHFDMPTFSMKTDKRYEGEKITTFDFRLINAKF